MRTRAFGWMATVLVVGCTATSNADDPGPANASGDATPRAGAPRETSAQPPAPFELTVPDTDVRIELHPVPGGEVEGRSVAPFWMATTELTWDAYDALIYATQEGVDASSRPTRPYITVDRGFGHAGYPALSMSFKGAETFCRWLSEETGHAVRLPTVDEWELACTLGWLAQPLDEWAWYADNAERKTHPVGELPANALGLHDLPGNVGEWCVDHDGRGLVVGGAYNDEIEGLACGTRKRAKAAWNASDPQIPKSAWWYADASFVGMRVVCDVPPVN